MALKKVDDACLKAIADELRLANGSTQKYTVDQMPDAIRSLTIGPGDSHLQWDDPKTCYVKISQKTIDDGYGVRFGIRVFDTTTTGGHINIRIKWGDEGSDTPSAICDTRSNRMMHYFAHKYSNSGEYTIVISCVDDNGLPYTGNVFEFYEYYSFYNLE